MESLTTVSAKGQCVIPAEVRARLRIRQGDRYRVLIDGEDIVLRRAARARPTITLDELYARVAPHDGAPATIEEINRAIDDGYAARAARGG